MSALTANRLLLPLLVAALTGCATRPPATPARGDFVFYPPDARTNAPCIQFLCHLPGAVRWKSERPLLGMFAAKATNSIGDRFGKPLGVAAIGQTIFVTDTATHDVRAMDLARRRLRAFGSAGDGALQFPALARASPTGNLLVTDAGRKQVVEFSPDGAYVAAYGGGHAFKPADVAATTDFLYLLDADHDAIKVYDLLTLGLIRTIGRHGRGPGEFRYPTCMTLDRDGNLYVADALNFRIEKFGPDGSFLSEIALPGESPGSSVRPQGIAVGNDGTLFVLDRVQGIVRMFGQDGRATAAFGGMGTGPGELLLPGQIGVDAGQLAWFRRFVAPDFEPDYLIYVTNQAGPNPVSVFAYGRLTD